jgi:hypothetical protein
MAIPSRSAILLVFALVAIPLATTEVSSRLSNEQLMQDGDEARQGEVLELLDQYVLHVDRGRTVDQTEESVDLLDQYVMHVDRGAHADLESGRSWQWDALHQAEGQDPGSRTLVQQNSKDLTNQGSKKNLTQSIHDGRVGDGDNWGAFRAINRVRRNIRGIESGNKRLIKPKYRLRLTHGIRSKRSLREEVTVEGRTFSDRRQDYMAEDKGVMERKPGQWSRSIAGDGKETAEKFVGAHSRYTRNTETGNKTDDSREDPARDLIAGPWSHAVQLGHSVHLSWNVVDGEEIEFLVEAATRGYVGVGFSAAGGMAAADIVLAWVDDNTGEAYLVVSSLAAQTTLLRL